MQTAARLTIDLDALASNYAQIARDAPGAEVAPVVKADGYGLGVGPVARRLWAEGARSFYVARLSEGEDLRAELGSRDATILVLDGLALGGAERMAAAGLTPVLNSLEEIDAWPGGPCALHIDTGMNRIGLPDSAAPEAARRLSAKPQVSLVGAMSHLAQAAEPDNPRSRDQLDRFNAARAHFPGVPAGIAASAGIYLSPAFHMDQVRPGICLYGGGPRDVPDPRFKAVATLTAPILQVRNLQAGDAVGYGAMFRAPRAMRLALVAAGYADGAMRNGFASGHASVAGRLAPLAIVAMDMIGVDISETPGAKPGDPVELLGPHIPIDDAARAAGTVAHEVLVRLSHRAVRIYLGGD